MSVVGARAATLPRVPVWLLGLVVLALAGFAVTAVLWRAPAPLPATVAERTPSSILASVERRAAGLEDGRMDLQAILATPEYFRITGQAEIGQRYGAERDVVIIYAEDIHFGELAAQPRPALLVDGRAYEPTRTATLIEGDHHRASVLVYADSARALASAESGQLELRVDGVAAGTLAWDRPFGTSSGGAAAGLSIPLLLALMGGMLASMWPCLFQLTAYFIPSVAGLSLQEASGGRADRVVLRTAVLFVSGIVIVYTLAGFATGLAAQSVAGTALLESARQPITLVAGLVIIAMAGRMAWTARRPLVCHMPTSSPTKRSAFGTVMLGLAFATGCMSCFGAAVILGMFTYVVTTASPFVGAAILFVFSLGIAVPLVAAAMAMARVLPLITRLERAAPILSLVSAAIMAGYGVLLITGTSHLISDSIARLVP